MILYNTLTRRKDDFISITPGHVGMYSCGPTVYDHIHIGNLSSFIYADVLRRTLIAGGFKVRHAMNFTDVDDKTIHRSRAQYPDAEPMEALKKLTAAYAAIFMQDMRDIGNDIDVIKFVYATEAIDDMRRLIKRLHKDGFAYIADDGVYFSIGKYRASGKQYGQLLELTEDNTGEARIDNDEYDKQSAHDFALWKRHKAGEPAWDLELAGQRLPGRPGWHIECAVMSTATLGQPFDIHTGGIDLIFPHHENEIAQSTAGTQSGYANVFFHNEHLLVDGQKMSKSLRNFYTLDDIRAKGFQAAAFRLMVLQSHYRSQSNFTWEGLGAAQNRLNRWRAVADLRWQVTEQTDTALNKVVDRLQDDLSTPLALAELDKIFATLDSRLQAPSDGMLEGINRLLGISLAGQDITPEQRTLLQKRQQARQAKAWSLADRYRDELAAQKITVRDSSVGQIWSRV